MTTALSAPLPRFGRRSRLVALTLLVLLAAASTLTSPRPPATVRVVVLGDGPLAAAAEAHRAGGTVERKLSWLPGVVATVPVTAVARLQSVPGLSVAADRVLRPASDAYGPAGAPPVQVGALHLGRLASPSAGAGAAVALVDTGVVETPDMAGRLVQGADLSGERDGVDRYGHGTFMAGLIAGATTGVASGAVVVSVKVAGADGETTLSRLVEGIGWVIAHRGTYGIRVVNLSFGVTGPGAYEADPLSTAVEAAWASGLVVVAASGNAGAGTVAAPGRDPWIVTAGAVDAAGTVDPRDDTTPAWSGSGRVQGVTKPDVVAPGVSVVSLRAPGSTIDTAFPSARVGQGYFRGSGTSMSAALVSGAAAVLAARHPHATPDDVKGALVATARPVAAGPGGLIDVAAADAAPGDPAWNQRHPMAADWLDVGLPRTMPWSLNPDPEGVRWNGVRWNDSSWEGVRWNGVRWNNARWDGVRWNGVRWNESGWDAAVWGDGPTP